MIECQYNTKIKQVHSDRTSEFKPLARTIENLVVLYHLTYPYTPLENGMVGSCHRRVVDVSLALLFRSHVFMSYWPFIFRKAVYTLNKVSSKVLNFASSYFYLYGSQFDCYFLKCLVAYSFLALGLSIIITTCKVFYLYLVRLCYKSEGLLLFGHDY